MLFMLASVGLLAAIASRIDFWDRVRLADGAVLEGTIEAMELPADATDANPTGPLVTPTPTPTPTSLALRPERLTIRLVDKGGASYVRTILAHELAPLAAPGAAEPAPPAVSRGFIPLVTTLPIWAIAGFVVLFVLVTFFASVRWAVLARGVKIGIGVWDAARLHVIGMYYMNTLPAGLASGDVIKSLYLRRHTGRVMPAMVSVATDRMLGLATLIVMALVAILIWGRDERFTTLGLILLGLLGVCTIVAAFLFSRRVTNSRRITRVITRLPGSGLLLDLQAATKQYAHAKRALLTALAMSLISQLLQVGMYATYGAALGIPALSLTDYLFIVPVVIIAQAIPGLPGGWGIGEGAFVLCFAIYGVPVEYGVALSVLTRASWLVMSLPGLWFALTMKRKLADEREEADDTGETLATTNTAVARVAATTPD